MGVAFVLALLGIVRYRIDFESQVDKDAFGGSATRPDTFGLVSSGGAVISLISALYYGALKSWRSAIVISFFTAGFGGCLFIFLVSQVSKKGWLPAALPFRRLDLGQALGALGTFLWGASYYSFAHFFRESSLLSVYCFI